MWIITVNGFISLVQDKRDKTKLQVRARVAEDITANFPKAEVYIRSGADYRYRAVIDREEVALLLAEQVLNIDYTSHFKDVALRKHGRPALSKNAAGQALPKNGGHWGSRYRAYYDVWTALANLQDYRPYSKTPRSEEKNWTSNAGAGGRVGFWSSGANNRAAGERTFADGAKLTDHWGYPEPTGWGDREDVADSPDPAEEYLIDFTDAEYALIEEYFPAVDVDYVDDDKMLEMLSELEQRGIIAADRHDFVEDPDDRISDDYDPDYDYLGDTTASPKGRDKTWWKFWQ